MQFWSAEQNDCTLPGCNAASVYISGNYGVTKTTTTIDYTYDSLYRLTAADYSTGEYFHYTYDSVGNRLTQVTQDGTKTSIYDEANRLTNVDGVPYTWDANGNLLSDGSSTYTYDSANRLIGVNGQSSMSSYRYNGLGDRLQQTVDGQPTTYVLDMNVGLTQVLSDGASTYTYGAGRIAQENTTTEYFLGDALGSVRQLADAEGTVILGQDYQPYGEVLNSAGEGTTAYGFTGEQSDPTGLVYLRARYYSPYQGRFMSRDTWGGDVNEPMSYNLWQYVYANPIRYTDPTGQNSFEQLYGITITGEWSSKNKSEVMRAIWIVANRFSQATAINRNGTYFAYTRWNIFRAVYGIRDDRLMTFKWDPHCYYCRSTDCQGDELWEDVDPSTCDCEAMGTCNCRPVGGVTRGSRFIEFASLWDTPLNFGEYVQNQRKVNNVVHELGHAFDARLSGAPGIMVDNYSKTIDGRIWRMNSRDPARYGFYEDLINSGTRTWVQTGAVDSLGSEVFADMFIGWVYSKWANDDYGLERARFMNDNMLGWIMDAMNRP